MTDQYRPVLTDEQIDDAQESAYRALVAQGYKGSMGGFQWDRESARAIERAAVLADREARLTEARSSGTPLLADDHRGMRVDYSGLLKQTRSALEYGRKEPGLAEMIRQLTGHMKELGQRWYAGDMRVVDEILQLYCVENDARVGLATRQQQEGGGTPP